MHFGSKSVSKDSLDKLKGYLQWVAERPEAKVFLMGDIFDVATRTSKTSPFESDASEVDRGIDFFAPFAHKIIGAISGNHEARLIDHVGWSPTGMFCKQLKIPYCGWSAVLRLQVGKRSNQWFHNTYNLYLHHTTGGGALGAALNRIMKLEQIVEGCDVYAGGHNHQLVTGVRTTFKPTSVGIEQRKIHYVSCGSYLDYNNSYAERGMYAPSKLGSPRIRFSGARDKHDVHVSI